MQKMVRQVCQSGHKVTDGKSLFLLLYSDGKLTEIKILSHPNTERVEEALKTKVLPTDHNFKVKMRNIRKFTQNLMEFFFFFVIA